MQPQEITIIIHSDIDPSQLLDIANEYGEQIAEEVKTYGEASPYVLTSSAICSPYSLAISRSCDGSMSL